MSRQDAAIDKLLKIKTEGRDDASADLYRHPYEPTPYSVLERLLESGLISSDDLLLDYLDFFEERGIGIINASPLSMGLLSQRGTPDWHPAPEPLKAACACAAAYCTEKGYPIEKLALQYSTSLNPRIATTLFSSANPENVLKNISYVNEPVDMEMVNKVREIIGDQMRVRWKNS